MGITCFNCNKEGHVALKCPLPWKDKGKSAERPQLFVVNVQEDAECKNACEEGKPNTFEMYSKEDKEDKPVAYFGAMHPEDEPLEEGLPSEDNAPMVEDNPPELEGSSEVNTSSDGITQAQCLNLNDGISQTYAVVIETPWGMVWVNRDGTVEHLSSPKEDDREVCNASLRISEDNMDLDPELASWLEMIEGSPTCGRWD
ncbi:hypothetical protein F5J12DRAFT_783060 [Pisolithus orientalis]|uniref:uncharacterized protein n=1 Tax=Pisolithus orientalis TaxID=936130 RepID=UPI002224D768|nr:uncharacterized protein F5J12DRAFT_783060 [Pisolithus orientalis]KAI6006294.1 hypothetical protein F5J12DRAFT_783060 [Pisolithus orientalis]